MTKKADNQVKVLDYIREHRIARPREMRALGVHPEELRRFCQKGLLIRPARGLYELPDAEPDPNQSLIEACKRVPKGVLCLLSALRFHGIGTQLPHQVWLAIPSKAAAPRINKPPIQLVYLSGRMYEQGIEEHKLSGGSIRVYSVAKTVVDCFRFRRRIGLDVAIEALRDTVRHRKVSIGQMDAMARKCRAANVMQPYLEAMI